MKITDIETHVICPPFQAWNSEALIRYHGPDFRYRTVFVLHTDNGVIGLGEHTGRSWNGMDEWVAQLIGTNPCDWLAHPALPIGLAPAIYDLVGKYNDVPAYKLFAPQVRSRVPMAAWTVSQTPAKMAEEVQHAAEAGYTWLKYHTHHFHNMIKQTEAMAKVAPPGFKIHYDINFDNTVEHVLDLARELARFPIAGAIEDPLRTHDFQGYRALRGKCPLPIYFHHLPLGGREALMELADGYMLGHSPVGGVVQRAGLFEAANVPFMTQNTGGNITRAFIAHMAAAFPMATLHHVTCTHLWAQDIVTPVLEVAGGTVRVPETPGLGVTLDREALDRWSATAPDPTPRALIRIQYAGLPPIYARPPVRSLSDSRGTGPSFVDGHGAGYNQPVDLYDWDDDGSERFAEIWERTAAGPVSDEPR
ncbi:MAG: mandelate racemase/muconate lactonizing enzyme family protein [Candidatus Poribacteria bacterium]|nr:mandelate racemase/muconate lactonizing enzyme family protein [Candidatus Poribacteria bacterium]